MYSVSAYGAMVAGGESVRAYSLALREAVKDGSVVLEIGTGLGTFAILACRLGARRVYAIEADDAIQVAREIAAANGYAERIVFIQELSTRVTLPEPADVIISDLRGVLPPFQRHIPSIADARRRFLAPAGTLIPQRDTLWAAVADAPELYDRQVVPWGDNTYGLDLGPARRILTNNWSKARIKPEQILLPAQSWATLDYTSVTEADLGGAITWTVDRPGTAHGLIVWFDTLLAESAHFSNAPGQPELIYGSAFFPWTQPVTLNTGDIVSVALHADLVGEDYVWRWDTRVLGYGVPRQIKADFHQNTLAGAPLSPQRLRRRAHDHVPVLSDSGKIAQAILDRMATGMRIDQISREIAARFPDRFPTWRDALTAVGELSARYSA